MSRVAVRSFTTAWPCRAMYSASFCEPFAISGSREHWPVVLRVHGFLFKGDVLLVTALSRLFTARASTVSFSVDSMSKAYVKWCSVLPSPNEHAQAPSFNAHRCFYASFPFPLSAFSSFTNKIRCSGIRVAFDTKSLFLLPGTPHPCTSYCVACCPVFHHEFFSAPSFTAALLSCFCRLRVMFFVPVSLVFVRRPWHR
ncbi:hypothetical protein TRVL_02005 [Trypanosoma vivax]|nr:hypothetical protein TRVL_02005 [Trypanosoma vivax]